MLADKTEYVILTEVFKNMDKYSRRIDEDRSCLGDCLYNDVM